MLKKEEKTVNNLERLVGRTVLESPKCQPIAEEVMVELTRRKYKEDYGSQKLGSGVVSLLKNEAIAAASGAAIGYLADGQEGALLGAQYGMTVYTTLWATLNSIRFLFKKRGVEFEEVAEKCKAKANSQIGTNLDSIDKPISNAILAGVAGGAIMAGASYPAEWIGQHLPYVSEVVENAKQSGLSAFEIGALFGIGNSLRQYFGALRSNAEIRGKFSEVASREQLKNPNLDVLLSTEKIYEAAMEHLRKEVNSGVLETPKGEEFSRKKVAKLIENYYVDNFKSSGLTQRAGGFAKKLGIITLAGAVVGYAAGNEEGTMAGAQYAASLYTMLYGAANALRLFKKSNPKSSLEKTIDHCMSEVNTAIDTNVKTYRKPLGTAISIALGTGLFLSGTSYLHDWLGSNIKVVNQIVQNADDAEISAFKIGCLFGLIAVASQYKRAVDFMKSVYKGLDDVIYSNRSQKARVSLGAVRDLEKNGFTRTNAEGILETPIIEYANADGKTVTYVGAIHIAEAEYFAKLQEELNSHERVFYEGVKKGRVGLLDRISGAGVLLNSLISAYQRMIGSYKLAFQGDKIDYKQDHWENVDTDAKAIIDRLNQSKTVAGGIAKQGLFYLGSALATGISFLANNVLYIPKTKLSQKLSEKEKSKSGLLDDIILKYRNEIVMNRLTLFTRGGGRDAAVFYGAAHLGELHKFVTEELGYGVKQVRWIEAW